MNITKPLVWAAILLGGAAVFHLSSAGQRNERDPDGRVFYTFDDRGELNRPTGYREWVFAGTGTTPKAADPHGLFPDFQNIYIDPESFKFWKQNGTYREGTILVKELIRKGPTESPIGKGFWQGDYYSISATIKDSKRFPKAPGGWGYFKFTNPATGKLNPTSPLLQGACVACHAQAAAGNGPFTELYAPMRDAKGFGSGSPEDLDTRKGLAAGVTEKEMHALSELSAHAAAH